MKHSRWALCVMLATLTPLKAQDQGHALPEFDVQVPPMPEARQLYQRTLDCWPSASRFRAELSLEGRLSQRGGTWLDNTSGQITSGAPVSASLVARLPLYSASEMDREREREWLRRRRAAEGVGQWLAQLADRQRMRQELSLMKSLEKRARQRVLHGIVDSSEQVHYMERVADLEGQLLRQSGLIERTRLELLGFCDQAHVEALDALLQQQLVPDKAP